MGGGFGRRTYFARENLRDALLLSRTFSRASLTIGFCWRASATASSSVSRGDSARAAPETSTSASAASAGARRMLLDSSVT